MAETRPDGTSPSSKKPKKVLGIYVICAFIVAAIIVAFSSSYFHQARNPAIEQQAVNT